MTSAQVIPEAYSLTVPSGKVTLMSDIVLAPSTPTGLLLPHQTTTLTESKSAFVDL